LDIQTYLRVIWRFRLIVGAGLILAIGLAGLTYFKVTFDGRTPHFAYRQSETWTSSARLAVTQDGVPVGTAVAGDLSGFTVVAASLADSDSVRAIVARSTHIPGFVSATPATDPVTRQVLPFISVNAFASKPANAVALANGGARALQAYVNRQQDATGFTTAQRVSLPIVNRASPASLSAGRRKTTPIVAFLAVMIAAIGLAFILENLRPRVHLVGRDVDDINSRDRRSA
jgi:hypothetical protein